MNIVGKHIKLKVFILGVFIALFLLGLLQKVVIWWRH